MAEAAIGLSIMGAIIIVVGLVTGYNMLSKPASGNSAPVTVAARRSARRAFRKSMG